MTEPTSSPSIIKDTAEAVKGIVEAVPVYEDMLQPASKELGKSMLTVAQTVNVALAPLSLLVWSYEKIKNYFIPSVADKLKDVPEDDIITPEPEIAVPAIEALRYTGHNDDLREMFSNLIASAMDKSTAFKAHPSFVEIIKQINSDEAKIIKLLTKKQSVPLIKSRLYDIESTENSFAEPLTNFSQIPFTAKCLYPELGPSYLENIERLGLINLSYSVYNTAPNAYDFLESHEKIQEWKKFAPTQNKRFQIDRGAMTLTDFGDKFLSACVR